MANHKIIMKTVAENSSKIEIEKATCMSERK